MNVQLTATAKTVRLAGFAQSVSAIGINVTVQMIVNVALWAMCFISIFFSRIAAPDIFSVGDRFKVSRIDAAFDAAQVVKLKSWWNLLYVYLVRQHVSKPNAFTIPGLTIISIHAAEPQPTSRVRLWHNSIKERLNVSTCHMAGVHCIAGGYLA